MKLYYIPILLLLFLAVGCAHSTYPDSSQAPMSEALQPGKVTDGANSEDVLPKAPDRSVELDSADVDSKINNGETGPAVTSAPAASNQLEPSVTPEAGATSGNKSIENDRNLDFEDEGGSEEVKASIADPLEPFNRAMYHFNDKLYFWVLKPVAQGYGKVVPEGVRISVRNFFSNLTFPIRFVNCLLQANFGGAVTEIGRFTVNTTLGIVGLFDPASSKDIHLVKQDEDFGQTLGVYGLGQGFYINWPILGPSSPRDTVGKVGDFFLHPFTYIDVHWEVLAGTGVYEKVNDTSLSVGDYESLKEAAIDPYIAIRDAYVQYRLKKVKQKGSLSPSGDSALQNK